MIQINGDTVSSVVVEYGIRYPNGEVTDFGDDQLGVALEAILSGGTVLERRVYLSEWRDSDVQPMLPQVPPDDEVAG